MHHLPELILDLALILGAAGVTTLVFRWLKQPVVLGYIITGFLVGPQSNILPTVSDMHGIKIWAEIGVIILLFALGLEFSFKKLAKVGASAGITGAWEIIVMILLGLGTGKFLGWPMMDCLFLGGIMAISSTTIIFRAFDELGYKTRQFTSLVMGVLIIEDLVAILLMVMLSTVAVSKSFEGTEMLFAILKLIFFLIIWFLAGIFLLPTLLKYTSKWLTNETLLLCAIALCLGMVVFADKVGFSAALGAFIMGSILSETLYGEKIEHLVSPVKNLFGAIFFVSVGMLIDPALLGRYAGPVLLVTLLVISGKLVNVTVGALLSGNPLRQAIQAGTSMTQIGEFSFIIATLGVTLNVTSSYLYPIAVGVSVITTFTTPYFMRLADPLYLWLIKALPKPWVHSLNRYSAGTQTIRGESDWGILIKAYIRLLLTHSVIIVALILISRYYLQPFSRGIFNRQWMADAISVALTLGAMAPFVWSLMAKKIQRNAYHRIEDRFISNLNEREKHFVSHKQLTPWDAHLARIKIGAHGSFLGETLENLRFREKFGINIAFIERGGRFIYAPSRDEKLFPYDEIGVIGTDIQLQKFTPKMALREDEESPKPDMLANYISLEKIIVDEHNGLKGKSIRGSGIREATHGLVVGIERNSARMLNPALDILFEWADVVWIVGDESRIRNLREHGKKLFSGAKPQV